MDLMKRISFKNTIFNLIILTIIIAIAVLIIGYFCGKAIYYLSL